ncbi:ABC transporter permease subunit [Nocardia abscessus]|uniref:ABC transporter permease subunit n=1 Tax=Nocardia abscessus TaxID=120957 RepID=UPI0024583568|nr:ATP-binding cassette domain-containing protein [Nocardia abscessus]
MADLLPFVIAGIVSGSVYGLAAVGLVLTYKTSGVFNFAHGAMATVSAYGFYTLHVINGFSWQLAAAICVLGLGPAMGLALELLARVVDQATVELRIAATIGILLLVQAGVTLYYGQTTTRIVPAFLPQGGFAAFGVQVQWSDVTTFGVAVLATGALSAALRLTRRGVAMRAVVGNAPLLDLAGTSPVRTRRWAWCVGTGLASLSGVLFAPLIPLDPMQLTLLVVQAFGAAAIGRFTSLPWSFGGGLLIGVFAALATRYFTTGLAAGVPAALPFLALFLVLLVMPRRFLLDRDRVTRRIRSGWTAPPALQSVGGVVVVVVLALVPSFAGIHLTDWTVALAMTLVFLSLGLLVRTSGQVSLCHVAFTAIGACAFSHLAVDWRWPWPLALLACGLVVVPIGAVLSIPAIRLSGLYLALATFGFGVVLQMMFYSRPYMFGTSGLGLPMPRPSVFGLDSDPSFYRLVLVLATVGTLIVVALDKSRLGRLLRGLAESPTALRTNGVSIEVTRVLVFCVSAFLAALGGALAGMAQTTASATNYQPLLSVTYFAVIVIMVGREPWYSLLAAVALILVPSYFPVAGMSLWLQVLFGILVVLRAATASRLEVPGPIRSRLDSAFRRKRSPAVVAVEPPTRQPSALLEVRDLSVRFGGVVAVDGVSFEARTGRITGLIGPNGAGKTTTFDACTGLVQANAGEVRLQDRVISRVSTSRRARLGIGRTFQRTELFDSLTVAENVAMGAEGPLAGANPLAQLFAAHGHAGRVRAAAASAMALCGIESIKDSRVGALSTGQRRLVELARCLAGPYRILLLDEPSAGLDRAETARFGQILRHVVAERGVGIVLVEHDMSLVLEICEEIFVLDFGRLIFRGSPARVRASEVVQHAYLGVPITDANRLKEPVA